MYMCIYVYGSIHVHILMRDEKERRKKQARSNKQQGSTPKAVTFPCKCMNIIIHILSSHFPLACIYKYSNCSGSGGVFSVAPEEREIAPGTTCLFTAHFKPVCTHVLHMNTATLYTIELYTHMNEVYTYTHTYHRNLLSYTLCRYIQANSTLKNWNALFSTK